LEFIFKFFFLKKLNQKPVLNVSEIVMDTFHKDRKEEQSYPFFHVRYSKQVKYHHSHERFVVPWQMEEYEEKEGAK
jgi:hypothetical protein